MNNNFYSKLMKNLYSVKNQIKKIMQNDDFSSFNNSKTFSNIISAQQSISSAIQSITKELKENPNNLPNTQKILRMLFSHLQNIDYQLDNVKTNNDYYSFILARDWTNNVINSIKDLKAKVA